jgi:hypothetical protein
MQPRGRAIRISVRAQWVLAVGTNRTVFIGSRATRESPLVAQSGPTTRCRGRLWVIRVDLAVPALCPLIPR